MFGRKPKLSPLGTAIEMVKTGIAFARKAGVLDNNRILCSCEVILDHLYWCHVALRISVDIVAILEDPRVDAGKMKDAVLAFKASAMRARLHQDLPSPQAAYGAVKGDTPVQGGNA